MATALLQRMQIELAGTPVLLLHQRALFLPLESVLVIGDLHLGKAMHFRKAGLFLPPGSARKDYAVLEELLQSYKPRQVVFLGDLFHSAHNSEWNVFAGFVERYRGTAFILVRGNHDILDKSFYQHLDIRVVPETLSIGRLIFSHEPLETVPATHINISGHIHPGFSIHTRGRQSLRLPCFYYTEGLFLLPAFGQLTGLRIQPPGNARIFAVLLSEVMEIMK